MDHFWFLSITNFMHKLNFQNERPFQVEFDKTKSVTISVYYEELAIQGSIMIPAVR